MYGENRDSGGEREKGEAHRHTCSGFLLQSATAQLGQEPAKAMTLPALRVALLLNFRRQGPLFFWVSRISTQASTVSPTVFFAFNLDVYCIRKGIYAFAVCVCACACVRLCVFVRAPVGWRKRSDGPSNSSRHEGDAMRCETDNWAEQGERATRSPCRTDDTMEFRWGTFDYYPHASGQYWCGTCAARDICDG